MNSYSLLVGTSKGLVVFSITGSSEIKTEIHFKGLPVSMLYVDERTDTWWAGLSHRHWGEKLHYSNDRGATWQVAAVPSYQGHDYRPGNPATLKKLWVMKHAGMNKPGCLWLGTEPGGLFYSADNGKSFTLNEGLWNHPSRMDDQQWFGTGKDYPFVHTIIIDPRNSDHIIVGVSCAGVFKSTDGGKTWTPKNKGLIAGYLPKATPDVGHDPHQILQCQYTPDVLWQQNHCGIFRSTDCGDSWTQVSSSDGYPSYGFALAIDDHHSETAWVIPAESDENRIPRELKLKVFKTTDGGRHWISTSEGLPQQDAFDLVLRHGFVRHENAMAFGTTNGNLYYSSDTGSHWSVLSQNLAPVNSLAFAV